MTKGFFPMMPPIEILKETKKEVIIRDANGITHFWTEFGYEGYSIEVKEENLYED